MHKKCRNKLFVLRTMGATRKRCLILFVALFFLSAYLYININKSTQRGLDLESEAEPIVDINKLYFEISSLKKELARQKLLAATECNLADKAIESTKLPVIYIVTPTFARPEQKAELTRLSQTFLLTPALHWIIIEDAPEQTELVKNLLLTSGISFTHLFAHTPKDQKLGAKDPHWKKPRGVLQRNTALNWIRANLEGKEGVVYFADDDNTYSVKLFEEMRYTKRVSVWPVGLVGGLMVERPIPNMEGKVTSFNAGYKPNRPFPIDMAGFGINLKHLLSKPMVHFLYQVESGYQESQLLKQLTTRAELEVKADNCTKVYVWHTRTEKPKMREELRREKENRDPSNLNIEV